MDTTTLFEKILEIPAKNCFQVGLFFLAKKKTAKTSFEKLIVVFLRIL